MSGLDIAIPASSVNSAIRAAMSSWVLPRVVSSGRRFLFAERDAMLRRARTLALGHRRRFLFLYRTARGRTVLRCLREEQRCDERERHRSGSRPPRPRRAEHVSDFHRLRQRV